MIPFSFPFSSKRITLKSGNNLITVDFQTTKRDEIIKQYFPQLPFEIYENKRKLPTSQAEVTKWIDNDRFGQLNYMYATYYFFVTEQNIDDIKKAMDDKYLPQCADIINRISKAYRLLVNQYFPRNFTKNDFIGYIIDFSKDKDHFFGEEFRTNVVLHQDYPEENLRININDFLKYDEKIRLHTDLIINAEDFFLEKNYRMCVIEANTAVETILFNILQKHYNTFPPNIQNEVSLNDLLNKKKLAELNKYVNIVSCKITGSNITEGTEWGNWKTKCHKLRNDIVHNRKNPNINETQNALSSSKVLLELLKDFLYDENDWILEATAFINDKEKAKKYLNKSNAVKPNADAYYYLGNIDFEDQKYDTARNYYREALKCHEHPFFYYNIGNCDKAQQLYKEAIEQYDKAINATDQFVEEKCIKKQVDRINCLKFLIRDPYNNHYYQKYLIIREQKLDSKPEDMINLFNTLLEVFPHNSELQKLRDDYSKSTKS
jgi:tetratricopeptide (TPR) repeat protein